jgi:tellurite resistance-related uncharacterized protein
MPTPYKSTPVFDEATLPAAIRNAHDTKAGVWGLLRALEGEARLVFHDPARTVVVTPGSPGVIAPQAVHHVELSGPARLQVEFYREPPLGEGRE